ncbi:MAG: DNRLRE domain-containing protein, partial [Oscillospiraceae bacterium]|nr:DNRLRE domain-containing protein [Oscillospiraceae bacterium]
MELTNRADGAIRRNINTLVAVAEKSPKLFDLRLLIKSIVFLLIFAMLATFAPLNGFAATAKSTPNVVTSVEAQVEDTEELPAEIVAEETSMRTENTKHFRMSDGTYQAAMYAEPVHYQDANGTWQDIDNTLIEKTLDGKKVLETTAGASKITLPESFAGGQKATLTNDGYSVAFGLSAENDEIALNKKAAKTDIDKLASKEIKTTKIDETKEELSKSEEIEQKNAEKTELKKLTSAVEYADILPDSSLEYIVSSNGIKENIVINAPQDEYIYKFDIDIGNLTPVPQENGSILLNDGEKAVYVIQPPYAYDAVGEHGAAAQSLDKIDGELMLTITLDSVWANDETRVFPVVLDPTIVFDDDDDNFGDTYVTNNIESMSILGFDIQLWDHTGNNSSLSFMTAGYASGSDSWARGFIKMKLPERPANSVIISATFEQKWRKTYGSSFQINAYEVPYEWVQAHVGEHFTWNNQPFGTAKNSYINNPILDSNVVNGKSLYRYDLTNLFRKQNDLNRNYAYVMLASANESGANAYADFNTVNAIDSSTHPMCNVIYAYPGGLEDFFTHETFGAGRAGTAYVGDYYRDVNIIRSE